jgi:hypothetical protein
MTMETIIIQTEGSKLRLLKQLLKELSIDFEVGSKTKSPYNQEFVNKIKERKASLSDGNYVELTEDYKKNLFAK